MNITNESISLPVTRDSLLKLKQIKSNLQSELRKLYQFDDADIAFIIPNLYNVITLISVYESKLERNQSQKI